MICRNFSVYFDREDILLILLYGKCSVMVVMWFKTGFYSALYVFRGELTEPGFLRISPRIL